MSTPDHQNRFLSWDADKPEGGLVIPTTLLALNRLWISTLELHNRFRGKAPSLTGAINAWKSEVSELAVASIKFHESKPGDDVAELRKDITEEAVDVLVTMLGILQACDIGLSDLIDQMDVVAKKNDAKTEETHWLNETNDRILKKGRFE